MKKIVSILLASVLIFSVVKSAAACEYLDSTTASAKEGRSGCMTYLFCGYDDAASNADSVILGNYNLSDNSLSFVQMPRDTYFEGGSVDKINSVFPSLIASGKSKREAMSIFTRDLSEALGVRIDGYIAYSTKTFAALVDTLGGVTVDLANDIEIKSSSGEPILSLKKGENTLSGAESLIFVRSRNEYKTGDLGRIDAQKIFISAFVKKVKSDLSAMDVIKICMTNGEGWVVNAKIGDFLKIAKINRGRLDNINTLFANMPGEAVFSDAGISYYSLSKSASASMLFELGFDINGAFDPNGRLLNDAASDFTRVYFSEDVSFKIYNSDTLAEIDLSRR